MAELGECWGLPWCDGYHDTECPAGWPEGEEVPDGVGYTEPTPDEREGLDSMGSSNA